MHGITGQFVGVRDCKGSPFTGCFDACPLCVRGGEVFGLDCLHSLKGINCPQNLRFRIGSPGNSSDQFCHINEVTFSGPVGRNMDRLESSARSGAKETIGARRADSLGRAKGLARRSFGTHAKGTPAHAAGDDKFRDGIHTGH
jgi:hypothetical protein